MALSNQQKAKEYYEKCKSLIKKRLADGTLSFSAEGKIVRSEIYQAINVSRAVMSQNPRIRRLLAASERFALARGVVSQAGVERDAYYERASGGSDPRMTQMQIRMSHLEKRVAALTVENAELRKAVKRADWIDRLLSDAGGTQGSLPW
jgi:hypothetical protein